ncbi:PREDICTED: diphthamide biosynthesis protein 1 [Fragaria vesca subsp. vesca]|uniref:diphthamide biosynthesis protein 1 n=1 Tax=Fragaria vesca subsp. vesca TaxID=101020 RepID=UPI0002C31B49|nr:PREDICTED: diphthamide biosynthesis protein 1 [Fragaria vesca subsp. vesca]XP_011460533.1 PREDICTED: diphthamide biosynthesis protein 1 [Fragaria vesca subsp. vesca]
MEEAPKSSLALLGDSEQQRKPQAPKRFVRSQIPDSILHDPSLNAAISLLPSNYHFEVHKCVWRVRSTHASRVALQLPEGLLMYSLVLSDILSTFGGASQCFVLGDATYGACCVDDLAAKALNADLLIHFGHSCLVPLHVTSIPCLYVFVEISIDVGRLIQTVHLNLQNPIPKTLVLAGTIQFASAIRAAKPELEARGFKVLVPQSKPLSAGEVLGCTAPKISRGEDGDAVLVFVADGRFHLEAFMIANPGVKAFRYDPYMGKLFLEEYDHKGMRESRKSAVLRAKEASNWGIVLGTLGRQGNPRILQRLEKKMREKGFNYTVVLMSEISPARIALFEDSVDAWIQIACPRLSIDWGEAFTKPLLNPFETDIALGFVPGWWERDKKSDSGCCACGNGNGTTEDLVGDYPMDYYAADGGEWNSSYVNKPTRPVRRDSALASAKSE